MKITTIKRQVHLPTKVAEQIRAEIYAGRLKPGDQLPTEQSLAASFGVSRNVVREAIARLRSDGIVQSRQGLGAFLMRTEPAKTLHINQDASSHREHFRHLFELRAMLEIRTAGIAADRRSVAHLKALKAALERMRSEEKWEMGGVDADLEFHRIVAQSTGNPYLMKVVAFISEQMRETIQETRSRLRTVSEVMDVTITEHAAIYEAISERTPAAARKAMSRHISNAAARLGVTIAVEYRS